MKTKSLSQLEDKYIGRRGTAERDRYEKETSELSLKDIRTAIEEGDASGYLEDFNPDTHLEELKAKRRNNG